MYTYAEVGSFLCSVSQTQCGNHVTFGCYAHASASSHAAFTLDLLPKMIFCTLNLTALRVVFNLLHDEIYLLELQIHDIVHHSLSNSHVFGKLVEVEIGLFGERIYYIAKQIDAKQTATVVRTERNFATWVGANCGKAQVGVTVGDAFTQYGVPEKHAWFCALPCVVHDFIPQRLGRDFFFHLRIVAIDGELLHVWFVVYGCLHKVIVDFHRHVCTRHLAFGHLRVDESFAVGMLNANRQHQRTTSSVLRHFACGVAVTFHKGHKTRRRKCRVVHRRTFGAYV